MAYIYKITNDVNGKMYIGKTKYTNPKTRWREHLRDAEKEKCKNRPLYNAINKYGKEHFHFEVIEETDNPEEREQYWINELRTYVNFKDSNGYNATLGGDGNPWLELNEQEVIDYHINEANYILGRTAKYFNVSNHSIEKILFKNNIVWIKNKELNQMKSYEEHGGVFQVLKDSRFVINVFRTLSETVEYMKKAKTDGKISIACNGGTNGNHYAYGYLWYYGKDIREAIEKGEIKEMIADDEYISQVV